MKKTLITLLLIFTAATSFANSTPDNIFDNSVSKFIGKQAVTKDGQFSILNGNCQDYEKSTILLLNLGKRAQQDNNVEFIKDIEDYLKRNVIAAHNQKCAYADKLIDLVK